MGLRMLKLRMNASSTTDCQLCHEHEAALFMPYMASIQDRLDGETDITPRF